MKHRKSRLFYFLLFAGWPGQPQTAHAQATPGNRPYNPYQMQFQRAWVATLKDPVKLIEMVPSGKRNDLAMLVEGSDEKDTKRHLQIAHWDGFKFATDTGAEFVGTSLDTLLAGKFREIKTATPTIVNGKRPPVPPQKAQIVTTENVYEWDGKLLTRLYTAPAGVKLVMEREATSAYLLAGVGDTTSVYTIGTDATQAVPPSGIALDNDGFARYGVGTQEFPGVDALKLGSDTRYVQSVWRKARHWMIGIRRGSGLGSTTGDVLVVYTPTFANRDRTFWVTRFQDCEESWTSEALPGHILDVRVGDPKNEGAEGLLVLIATNSGKDRALWFFSPTSGLNGR